MDCCGQWISLTAVKFSCQDQAHQRTETPANRLSPAVSITTEPWGHRSKGTKEVHVASCLDFHGFINLSHEGRELAKETIPVSHHCLSWASPWRGKLGAPQSLWHCFHVSVLQQMCRSRGDPVCDHLGDRDGKTHCGLPALTSCLFALSLEGVDSLRLVRHVCNCPAAPFIKEEGQEGSRVKRETKTIIATSPEWLPDPPLGHGAPSLFSLQLCPSPVPVCPPPTGTVRISLGTPLKADHSFMNKTLKVKWVTAIAETPLTFFGQMRHSSLQVSPSSLCLT